MGRAPVSADPLDGTCARGLKARTTSSIACISAGSPILPHCSRGRFYFLKRPAVSLNDTLKAPDIVGRASYVSRHRPRTHPAIYNHSQCSFFETKIDRTDVDELAILQAAICLDSAIKNDLAADFETHRAFWVVGPRDAQFKVPLLGVETPRHAKAALVPVGQSESED